MPHSTENEAQAMQVYGFTHPLKKQLEDAIGLQGDMERAQSCLQLLIGPPAMLGGASLFVTALYTQALVSYVRCFAKGRRGCLNRDIFAGRPDMDSRHEKAKRTRDRHIAHSVDEHEHVNILVAAEHEQAPAVGLGVRAWFFTADGIEGLAELLELVQYVLRHLEEKVERLGNELAEQVVGPGTSWKAANESFADALAYVDPVYGPTRPGLPVESQR